ncbi:hypothetical protein [Niabella beijingensis]|uniref:hypothetical protein n=1 Tax=Niabella beijingensis TaxID=2872700 RepID=UPI001CC03F07|nr:hypothetical protein [Niabella beijingensis]MBZ4190467.1 hypothetical protein [Niabella beijingensis]
MKLKSFSFSAIALAALLASCGGAEGTAETAPTSFCNDSACITEPLRLGSPTPDKPFVTLSFKDCKIDSIHFDKAKAGKTDIVFSEFFEGSDVKPSKSLFGFDYGEGQSAWLKFNDCATGRGYLIKMPMTKEGTPTKYKSAVNSFDPKFKVADGLVSYYDNTFIYVEDIQTGKVAKTLLTDKGVKGVDHDNVHSFLDSVNISKDHIYAKIKYEGEDIIHDDPLSFK